MTTRCEKCGSDKVQHAMWVCVNTQEVLEPFGSWCNGDNNWCGACEAHTKLVEEDELPMLTLILKNKNRLEKNVDELSTILEIPEEVILERLRKAGYT